MAYKPSSLSGIINSINTEIFLPHIQRPFVWDQEQMHRLFDSLMRNFPIQTFLFWHTKEEIKTRRFMDALEWDIDLHSLYDIAKSQKGAEKRFILDGQQRIQTLVCLFNGGIRGDDGRLLEAYVDLTSGSTENEEGLAYGLEFSASPKDLPWYRLRNLLGKDNQKNAEDIADTINNNLDVILKEESGTQKKERERLVRLNVSQLVSLVREERHFWIQTLDGISNDYPYQKILDIFVRVNSGGTKLDAADLMFAAMKEAWTGVEENLEEVIEQLNAERLAFDKTFALKCLLVANDKSVELTTLKFHGREEDEVIKILEQNWDKAEQTFLELRDFITNDLKIYCGKVVRSYLAFVPLFDYLYNNPKPNERNRVLMKGYYYKSQLFNWYAARTDGIINALHNNYTGKRINEFPLKDICQYFNTTHRVETVLAKNTILNTRLRYIVLNLIYVEQFQTSPFNVKFKGNEPHIDHIYPKSVLRREFKLADEEINHIGNYRFVGATDNIRKRAEFPDTYFSRLKASLVPIEKHLLCEPESEDPVKLRMVLECYTDFRNRRAELIYQIANKVVNPELILT